MRPAQSSNFAPTDIVDLLALAPVDAGSKTVAQPTSN